MDGPGLRDAGVTVVAERAILIVPEVGGILPDYGAALAALGIVAFITRLAQGRIPTPCVFIPKDPLPAVGTEGGCGIQAVATQVGTA